MWYANFYFSDWTGKKRHVCKRGFKTQREAKEYERSFLDQQSANSDILFSNLVENYMNDMGHRLKPTTMSSKEHIIRTKLLPYFGNTKVCDIDTISVRKWQNELLAYRDENGCPYAQTYLKSIHNQLSTILNYAVRHYRLRVNPCHLAGSIGKKRAAEMKFWTREQYEQFAGTIKKSALKLGFDILFFSGIREGELLALTPADILPDRKLNICKNYAKVKGQELFMIPKTDKSNRVVSIPEFLYNEIQEYISRLYGIDKGDRIFYYTKSALIREIKVGALAAGLEPIRVHDLRHSHASMLINMKIDIMEISERLGHESVKTTWDTYAHLYPDTDIELAERLNELRLPAVPSEEAED